MIPDAVSSKKTTWKVSFRNSHVSGENHGPENKNATELGSGELAIYFHYDGNPDIHGVVTCLALVSSSFAKSATSTGPPKKTKGESNELGEMYSSEECACVFWGEEQTSS